MQDSTSSSDSNQDSTPAAARFPFRWVPKRWGLRTFLIVVTVLCLIIGWLLNSTYRQKRAIRWVKEMQGTVVYDFQYVADDQPALTHGPIRRWIRDHVDVDFVSDVKSVHLPQYSFQDHTIESLWPLVAFSDLENLELSCVPSPDLSPLKKLSKLKRLYSFCSGISDVTPLAEHPSLEDITIYVGHVKDAKPLTTIPNLKYLSLDRSGATNEHIESIKAHFVSKESTFLFNGAEIRDE